MVSMIRFLKEKQLKPAWIFDAGTLIWRIFFTSNNLLIGETRNPDKKSTSFFCIDLHSGKPLWQNIGFDESWWIGIETVHEKWLILHGYIRPDMPEHRGIRVIDIESGKLLWKNDTLSYWFIDHELLYAHKYLFEKHIACELDIITGEILHENSDNLDQLREIQQKISQKESERPPDVMFPEVFDPNDEHSAIRTTVQHITEGKALEGWVEFLAYCGMLIVSHYRQSQNPSDSSLLNNILSVYDLKNEKNLHNEIIAEGVKVPSQDSFFIKDNLLLFIKHQNMLTALQPWK